MEDSVRHSKKRDQTARNGTSTWMHLSVAVIVTQGVREEELQKNFCLKVLALSAHSSTRVFAPQHNYMGLFCEATLK